MSGVEVDACRAVAGGRKHWMMLVHLGSIDSAGWNLQALKLCFVRNGSLEGIAGDLFVPFSLESLLRVFRKKVQTFEMDWWLHGDNLNLIGI